MKQSLVIADTSRSPFAKHRPVPVNAVRLTDRFWQPRIERNRTATIPSQYQHCVTTNRMRNFQRAAGKVDAPFEGIYFNDSDVYKWLEAAASALATNPDDDALRTMVNEAIEEIGAAQQPDGYLNTYFMFDKAGERWGNVKDMHELYLAGHLFQAAVAHFRATGEESLLTIARKFADEIVCVFGPKGRLSACGHPEIELGMVELYRATGNEKYLAQAIRFIDARGGEPSNIAVKGGDRRYMQDHVPFRDLNEVTGHAVRMLYLSAGATDAVIETGEDALKNALDKQYANFTNRRMYVSGGAGSRYEGEAFGRDYELTNDRAYTETCAAIASVMWNYRMLLLTGEVGYADALEWTLINAVLPGVSLDQKMYFYQNPLENDGSHRRQEWFGCACCPPNVARTLAQLTGYFYTQNEDDIFVHLYANGEAVIATPSGETTLTTETVYPWDGDIQIIAKGKANAIQLRIPAWAEGATINGQPAPPGTYASVPLTGGAAEIRLSLPMPVRKIAAHPYATVDAGLLALARGPVLYCLEQADHETDIRDISLPPDAALTPAFRADLLDGVTVLTGTAPSASPLTKALYAVIEAYDAPATPALLTAIPYYAWANREPGQMRVWIPMR